MTVRRPARPGSQPSFTRGARVRWAAPGLTAHQGEVISLKPGATCWWIEIREQDGATYAVPMTNGYRIEEVT